MNVRVNEKYLSILRHVDIIISFFSLIEYFPIFYYSLSSTYYLTAHTTPRFLTDTISKISYIYQIKNFYTNNSSLIYLIGIFVLFLFFLIYKFVLLTLSIKHSQIFNFIVINLYEIIIFRMISLQIIDIEIKTFLNSQSFFLSLFGCFPFALLHL